MIYPVTRWLKVIQYDNTRVIYIAKLFETMWLIRYLFPTKIVYYQVSQFISHAFRKYLIEEEYGIVVNPRTSGNPFPNSILENVHAVIGNLVQTNKIKDAYINEYDLWLFILVALQFTIFSTKNRSKFIVCVNYYLAVIQFFLLNIWQIGN